MTTDIVTSTEKKITKDEPVIVAHAALWVVAVAGEILVGRTHVVTAHEWSALSSTLIPIVTTGLLALSAWLMRAVVSPAGVFAERVEKAVQDKLSTMLMRSSAPAAQYKGDSQTVGTVAAPVVTGPYVTPENITASTPPTPPAAPTV